MLVDRGAVSLAGAHRRGPHERLQELLGDVLAQRFAGGLRERRLRGLQASQRCSAGRTAGDVVVELFPLVGRHLTFDIRHELALAAGGTV